MSVVVFLQKYDALFIISCPNTYKKTKTFVLYFTLWIYSNIMCSVNYFMLLHWFNLDLYNFTLLNKHSWGTKLATDCLVIIVYIKHQNLYKLPIHHTLSSSSLAYCFPSPSVDRSASCLVSPSR